MNIQTLLKELIGLGFSQQEIAEYIGSTQATVSRVAAGKWSDVRLSTAERIQEMLEKARSADLLPKKSAA